MEKIRIPQQICAVALCIGCFQANAQEITRAGSQPSAAGPSEYFTGRVRVDPVWPADANINASGGLVTFEPGALRVAYASGRTTAGGAVRCGAYAGMGKALQVIRPSDVVWCPPAANNSHGAAATTAKTHLAVTGTVDGKNVNVNWMEKVSDEQYNAR